MSAPFLFYLVAAIVAGIEAIRTRSTLYLVAGLIAVGLAFAAYHP